jgi:hypothetical protein
MSHALLLPAHVYACVANRHLVFLDLRQDKYLCLDQASSEVVGAMLRYEVACGASNGERAVPPAEILSSLLARNLVTQDTMLGRPGAPASVPEASETFAGSIPATLGARHIAGFASASISAGASLRWQPIERIVERVRRAKPTGRPPATARPEEVAEVVASFGALRPYYPRPYLCLFDSLALLNYAARFGLFPTWVFAVRMDPFAAHCWVQDGSRVLNDTVEHVREYTPIMSV